MAPTIDGLFDELMVYPIAFGNPATVPRMSAACQLTCLFHFQCSNAFLKKCIPERPPMSRNIAIFFVENVHQESTTNQTRWHTNDQQIVVWRRLGAVCVGGLGAQRAQKLTQMHSRMRKPRSWLTLGGCFLVQFVLFLCFFCCLFVLAPGTVFYRFLCDFEHIFDSISGVFWSKMEVVFLQSS